MCSTEYITGKSSSSTFPELGLLPATFNEHEGVTIREHVTGA